MNLEKSYREVMELLRSMKNPKNVAGMAKFGICTDRVLGIPMPSLRSLAKEVGKDHELATLLWSSQIREAMILASLVAEKEKLTSEQMDEWIKDFNSWDVCDQTCLNLFCFVPTSYEKAKQWATRKKEFERRASFALIACLASKDKKTSDSEFEKFFKYITKAATDERNFVKKAVNWALRQIGKRNLALNKKARLIAQEIKTIDSKSARWIAADALRELGGDAVLKRLKAKK